MQQLLEDLSSIFLTGVIYFIVLWGMARQKKPKGGKKRDIRKDSK